MVIKYYSGRILLPYFQVAFTPKARKQRITIKISISNCDDNLKRVTLIILPFLHYCLLIKDRFI